MMETHWPILEYASVTILSFMNSQQKGWQRGAEPLLFPQTPHSLEIHTICILDKIHFVCSYMN